MPTIARRRSLGSTSIAGFTLAVAAACAAPCAAQPQTQSQQQTQPAANDATASTAASHDESRLTLRVEPVVWYAGYSGKLRMPGQSLGSSKTTVGELDGDSPRLTPSGSVLISSDKWSFGLGGTAFSINDRSVQIGRAGELGSISYAAGDTLTSSFDFNMLEATVGYRLGRWELDDRAKGGIKLTPELHAFAGARMYDLEYDLARTQGGSLTLDRTFIEAIAGLRGSLRIAERFSVDVTVDLGGMGGGNRSSFSWDVMAGFSWQPVDHLGILVGYRNLAFDLESGDGTGKFRHDGAIAGLYFGLDLRF